MNAYQKAKLLMGKGLIQLCDEFPAIIALVVAFQAAVNALKAKVAEIEETAQLAVVNLTGITADKTNLKNALCQLTADIAQMIYAYAAATANNTLKQEVNFTLYKLQRMRDAELILVCRTIHDRADDNKDALSDYGITNELITALNTATDDFAAAMPKPRTAIGKRKSRKEILKQQFKELDFIINEQLDKLIGKFRTSHPEFYEAFIALRDIPDPSTTPTQLKGKITDASDNAPIKDAIITIVELNKTTKTNSAGEYSFKPIAFGKFTVTITKEGYEPYENDEIEIKMGDIKHLNVSLVNN